MAILVDDSVETILPIGPEAFALIELGRLRPAPQGAAAASDRWCGARCGAARIRAVRAADGSDFQINVRSSSSPRNFLTPVNRTLRRKIESCRLALYTRFELFNSA